MAFDKQKIISLLELVGGPRAKAFFVVAFPEATEAELNEALVALSLEGAIEMHSDGISLAGVVSDDTASDFQYLDDEQIVSELEDAHARFYTGLGHLPDVPIIGVDPAQAFEAETMQSVKPAEEPQDDEGPQIQVDIPDELWVAPIELLNLREPVVRNLNRSHIHSIQDLVNRSEADIMALRGMGLKKVNEVIDALTEIGLSLSMTPLAPDAAFFTTQKKADAMERLVSAEPETPSGPVSIDGWFSQLKENQRQAMEHRLEGKKLQQVGDAMGVTRERVRQLQSKALKNRPELEEDEYRYLFDTYDLSADAFCAITGEPSRTYYYLRITSENKNGGKPIHEMLEDEQIPESMKEALRETGADAGAIYIDGDRIGKNKHAIAAYLLNAQFDGGPISLEQLYDAYVAFLKSRGLEDENRLNPKNPRAFGVLLERNREVLYTPSEEKTGEGGTARSFDATKDFTPLREALKMLVELNVECSTAWLLKQEPIASLARVLDIRNGNELHVVIRRYCGEMPGVTLGRMPMITLGQASRDEQVLNLAKEMAPVTATDLANEYEKRYGVAAPTFKANFMNGIDDYLIDGRSREGAGVS